MNKMNITKYKREPDEKTIYYGKASIKKGYYVANGDEHFYDFVGDNSCYSMTELIHMDEVEDFLGAVEKLHEQPQCIIARVRCYNSKYRWLYMILRHNGRVLDGFESFDIEFNDIMSINENYVKYLYNVKKYREFMSLSPQMFFEYEFASEEFQIYRYKNTKSYTVFKGNLDKIKSKVFHSDTFNFARKAEFESLYEFIKKGADRFDACIDASIFEDRSSIMYKIKGSTIYKDDKKDMVVGTIVTGGKELENQAYYLSDKASDPGTGLLNKRAINEYAIDKILDENKSMYFVIMDVDDFKSINDAYGHMFGDEVLSKVSEIIRSVISARGVAGRFGGDEFMIVFDGVNSEQDLRRIIKTISKHVQWAYAGVKENLTVTTSFGISKYPDDGISYEELFKKADKCLYIAKEKGKNRYVIYDEKKHGSIKKNDDSNDGLGMRAIISGEKKSTVMSEIVLDLHKNGKSALVSSMEKISANFDMDGITIYCGEDFEKTYSIGNYSSGIEYLTCMKNQDYLDMFDTNGVYIESKIKRLEGKLQDAYDMYEKQESGKFIQCAAFHDSVPKSVISFDFFKRSPKFGTMDTGLITIVGKLMAVTASES